MNLAAEFARGMNSPKAPAQLPLRPPGVVSEAKLHSVCPTCQAPCVEACHQRAIFIADGRWGPRWKGTPAIMPTETPCYLCTEMVCISACPNDVLVPTSHGQVRMGRAFVEPPLCSPLAEEGCDACLTLCPLPGALLNEEGKPPMVTTRCVGCGLCVWTCPAKPRAVTVMPLVAPSTR